MLLETGTIPFCGRHLFNKHSHMTLTLDKSCEIFMSCCCKGSTEHHPKEMETWKGFNLKNRNLSSFGSVIYSAEYIYILTTFWIRNKGMCQFISIMCCRMITGTKTVWTEEAFHEKAFFTTEFCMARQTPSLQINAGFSKVVLELPNDTTDVCNISVAYHNGKYSLQP